MILTVDSVVIALIFGLVPALIWMFFWLREDVLHPEPRTALALTFFVGMCMVLLVIPLQKLVLSFGLSGWVLYGFWAFIEETAKLLAAYLTVLTKKVCDEPIDALIYLITAALGFAALENIFFLLNPTSGLTYAQTIATGMFRFMGANAIHILSSSVVGAALALSFYAHKKTRIEYALCGLILAGTLHTVFNIFILQSHGPAILSVFVYVWVGIVMLLLFFEYIKRAFQSHYL